MHIGEEKRQAMATARQGKPLSVAICIGTYNQAQYIGDAIASALAQSYPIQEIWVSDDASSDETEQVMAKICAESPAVHYYRQPKNLGICRNLSWVLAKPQTDIVVRLDSDDRLESDYVEVLTALMVKHPEAGFAHSEVFEMDGSGARTRVRRLARIAEFESGDEALRKNASGFRVAANCLLYRSAALAKAQYYLPTANWRAAEDWNLCVRIAADGWGNVYAPRPLSNYRVWDDALNVRASRAIEELSKILSTYEDTLMPEYLRRGWNTAILRKNMRKRAVSCVEGLDSAIFSDADREAYKVVLRKMGNSLSLSIAIFMAESGFNPLLRLVRAARRRAKDLVKNCLRLLRSLATNKGSKIESIGSPNPVQDGKDIW